MIKTKLFKAIVIGFCISALSTGMAFAQESVISTPVKGEQLSDAQIALYAKQKEIDQYLLVDHTKEIADKGIEINYTAVTDTYVEIGISPFNDDNANYLYDIFGKDIVKVVEFDQSILYSSTTSSGVAPDATAVTDEGTALPANDEIYTTTDIVIDKAGNTGVVGPAEDGKVYKGNDQEMTIQIESLNPEAAKDDANAQLVYATGESTTAESKGLSIPVIILIIAGGAVLFGGAILLTGKNKIRK